MRTTLDLPDSMFRRLKARAALEGVSLKDLLGRYVTAGLQGAERSLGDHVSEAGPELVTIGSAFDAMHEGCGVVRSGQGDLATNPKHMEGFGRD